MMREIAIQIVSVLISVLQKISLSRLRPNETRTLESATH